MKNLLSPIHTLTYTAPNLVAFSEDLLSLGPRRTIVAFNCCIKVQETCAYTCEEYRMPSHLGAFSHVKSTLHLSSGLSQRTFDLKSLHQRFKIRLMMMIVVSISRAKLRPRLRPRRCFIIWLGEALRPTTVDGASISTRIGPSREVASATYSDWARLVHKMANKLKLNILLFHVPWYNSNKAHQGEGDQMMAAMEPLLYAASVDLVFAGHVHGHGELKIVNSTYAFWSWHMNDDDPVRSDEIWITSLVSSKCVTEKGYELRKMLLAP